MRNNRLIDPGPTARPLEPLVFAMRTDYRRSAVYCLLGIVLILAARLALNDFLSPNIGGPWASLIVFACSTLIPLMVLRWRLRVDSSGLSCRRIWGWDLWSWDRLEQGRVFGKSGKSKLYVFRDKPFWNRTLTLILLEESHRAQVESIINRRRVRPVRDRREELALRDRVHVTSRDEFPESVVELHDHRTNLGPRGRELTVCRRVVVGLGILFLGLVLLEFPPNASSEFRLLAMSGVTWGFILMILRSLERDHRQAVAKLGTNGGE